MTIHLKMDSMSALTYINKLGGGDLPTAELPSQEAMAVVHGEEYPPQSSAPSRCIEHHCRQRVSGHERPMRLAVMLKNISLD